jgi:hypothetical protein
MTTALNQHDWSTALARRTQALGGGEITAILALAGATEVITFSGGFPDPATFPTRSAGGPHAGRHDLDDTGGRLLHLADGAYIWLTAPDGVDTVALAAAARARKVAYVPGRPFYPGEAGRAQMRLAYSRMADHLIDEGVRRIGAVVRTALEDM